MSLPSPLATPPGTRCAAIPHRRIPPPGPVGGVAVTGTTTSGVALSWTNPTAADFAADVTAYRHYWELCVLVAGHAQVVRYQAPIMVCIDLDETGHIGTVVNVVLGTDHDDVALARDYRGQFLVYDEAMQRIETDEETEGHAIKIAEHRIRD
jgi:hypothetical protein